MCRIYYFVVSLLLFCILLLPGCTSQCDPVSGGGVGAGNARVAGVVLTADGTPAPGAHVHVCPAEWLADTATAILQKQRYFPNSTITDSSGCFQIEELPLGTYLIEASDGCYNATVYACTVTVAAGIDLGSRRLRPYASVAGKIGDSEKLNGRSAYVRVYGLMHTVKVDSSGCFLFNNLPEGVFDLNVTTDSVQYGDIRIRNVAASATAPNDIGTIEVHTFDSETYASWPYHRFIRLHTKGISEPVADFPLLVRLDASSIPFSQTYHFGQDLRFAKTDGTHLHYEIASWDSAANAATIWVLMDTIIPAVDTQRIVMFWGNSSVNGWSDGADVFTVGNNFAGVFHLENSASGANATRSTRDGVLNGTVPVAGIIGKAADFSGSDYILLPAGIFSPENHRVTFSFWEFGNIETSAKNSTFRGYDSLGNAVLGADIPCNDANILWFAGWESDTSDIVSLVAAEDTLYRNRWNYWTFNKNVDDGTMKIYLNGTLVVSDTGKTKPFAGVVRFTLGSGSGQHHYFSGRIDEFRAETIERTANWIRLCHENQRIDRQLLSFEE